MTTVRAALTVASLTVVAACGVGIDEAPRTIEAADVGYDLVGTSTSTTTTVPGVAVEKLIFLISSNDDLVAVKREVPARASVGDMLESLLAGAGEDDRNKNYRSAVPTGTRMLSQPVVDGDVIRLDLSEELHVVQGDSLKRALAQIVYTATEGDDASRIMSVEISVNGTPRPAIDQKGVNKQTVAREDYSDLYGGLPTS